jgi:tetratricopeptide (TPR) repeat protein
MGGQGKTQLALEYCRLWKNKSGIFWIDATSEQTAKNSFALLSHILDPKSNPALDVNAKVAVARRALANRVAPWLMVFDNYDDPTGHDIRKFMTDNEASMIIVTSRNREVAHLADKQNRIELLGLTVNDAIKLLLVDITVNYKLYITNTTVLEQASTIVSRLGHHPLAIAQASAYIQAHGLQLDKFLVDYNERQEEILKNTTPFMTEYRKKINDSDHEIPMSVFTTSELSFTQLLIHNQNYWQHLHELLTLLAFFDSTDVSEAVLRAYCRSGCSGSVTANWSSSYCGSAGSAVHFSTYLTRLCENQINRRWDQKRFHRDILQLNQMSLVEILPKLNDDGFHHLALHPLIRDWLRLRTQTKQTYISIAAVCTYRSLILHQTRGLWQEYNMPFLEREETIRHVNAYDDNIKEFSHGAPRKDIGEHVHVGDRGLPPFEFSRLLHKHAEYSRSEFWARLSIAQRSAQFGTEGPGTLLSMDQLALALGSQGRFAEAENLHRDILRSKQRTLESDDPSVLATKLNIAGLLISHGRLQEAESTSRHVCLIYQLRLGESDPNTIIVMGILGNLLNQGLKYEEAEQLNRRGLLLSKQAFGLHHRRTLAAMGLLGASLAGLGRINEAECLLRSTFRLMKMEWGKRHPQTIVCLNHLASVLYRQGQYEAALAFYLPDGEVESIKDNETMGQLMGDMCLLEMVLLKVGSTETARLAGQRCRLEGTEFHFHGLVRRGAIES